ncbi:MAG: HNH endonuclease [Parabacteroides sp.]|nr:HNH endonuclease [Parabacteroides sp.]
MKNKRKKYSPLDEMILFNEVDGRCPLCDIQLFVEKQNKSKSKKFQIAHIYPLNPSNAEIEELCGESRLADDVNDLKNVIAVCPNCHTVFDKPRTREEYQKWFGIKKSLLDKAATKEMFSHFTLEEEIGEILSRLNANSIENSLVLLNYNLIRVDNKLDSSVLPLTKKTIKDDIANYYRYIEESFKRIEGTKPGKSELIAAQVRLAYLKMLDQESKQEVIHKALIDWLNMQTGEYSRQACSIIVSFFIQSCEIFSDSTK